MSHMIQYKVMDTFLYFYNQNNFIGINTTLPSMLNLDVSWIPDSFDSVQWSWVADVWGSASYYHDNNADLAVGCWSHVVQTYVSSCM